MEELRISTKICPRKRDGNKSEKARQQVISDVISSGHFRGDLERMIEKRRETEPGKQIEKKGK